MVRRDTAIELVLEHERLRLAGLREPARQLYETSASVGKGSEMLRAAPGQLGRPSPADSCRSSASAGAGATVRRRFIAVLFFGG